MAKKIALELDIKSTSVGEATKKTTSFTSELRKLREQMASGELKGEAFDEAAARAAKMQDQMDKVNKTVRNLANDNKRLDAFVTTAQGIVGGFAAAQGAAALFGSENEDLQKTMVKLQAAMTVMNGLQQVSNLLRKESALNTVLLGKANVTTAATTKGLTIATRVLSVATTGFGKALIATGIGAIVVGLGMLIANFDKVKAAVMGAVERFNGLGDTVKNVISIFLPLVGIIRLVVAGLEKMGAFQESAADKYAKLEKATKANNKQMERDIALMEAQGASARELYSAKRKLLYNEYELMKAKKDTIGLTEEELEAYKDLINSIAVLDAAERVRLDKEKDDKKKKEEKEQEEEKKKRRLKREEIRKENEENAKIEQAALEADAERRLQLIANEEKREIALLQNKHAKELAAAKQRKEDVKLLEELQGKELQALTDKFSKEREDKEIQDDAKRLQIAKANEQNRLLLIEDEQERELALLEAKHREDLAAAKLRGEDFKLLEQLQGQEIDAIKTKFREKEEADERAKDEALLAAKMAFGKDVAGLLSGLSAAQKENSKAQKALGLAAIGVDTGVAISAAVKASQANPLNAVTGGAAGVVQFGASLAQILIGAKKAKNALNGGNVSAGGGGAGGGGRTTELRPPTQINRDIQLQDRGGTQQRVFVLENDITKSQDRIVRIKANSTID